MISHRTIWAWYALPLLVSVLLAARTLLYELHQVGCRSCMELQIFVLALLVVLPWLALTFSYMFAALLSLLPIRSRALRAHLAAGPIALGVAYIFVINTTQYLR